MRAGLYRALRVVWVIVGILAAWVLVWAFLLRPHEPEPQPEAPATPTEIPTSPPQLVPTLDDDESTQILELFSPSDQSLTHQITETTIRQHIEQVITNSFVLRKCKLISEDEYADSFRASVIYAQVMNYAPDEKTAIAKVHQLTESAGTGYSLVYGRTPCDNPKLPAIAEHLLVWQQAYLAR